MTYRVQTRSEKGLEMAFHGEKRVRAEVMRRIPIFVECLCFILMFLSRRQLQIKALFIFSADVSIFFRVR